MAKLCMKIAPAIIAFLILSGAALFAQPVRVAVLPFQNQDGNMDLNIWSYKLQDSVAIDLRANDQDENVFRIVPIDSIEMILAEMNLDPNNPQYPSDVWKAVEKLNVDLVISGTFNFQANRILINAYVYDPKIKLADPRFQAKDIFKKPDAVMEAVPRIVKQLLPALKPQ
jgi:TolB-like protein